MSQQNYDTTDVFGVKSKIIQSYIERERVDLAFQSAIEDGNQVIIYGSSKQGKTSLLLKNLDESEYIKVECAPPSTCIDIYKSILRQLGVQFVEFETTGTRSQGEVNGTAGVKIKIPVIAEIGFDAGGKSSDEKSASETIRNVEYNLALAQDITEILKAQEPSKEKRKYLVLENFHYLSQETQKALAYDLRVFQDQGIIFIILGIWREANRLVQYNGDLVDRITEIPVEPWTVDDFKKVINKGSEALNVDFSHVQDELISNSFDSIGVIQEICKHCCFEADVFSTSPKKIYITHDNLECAIKKKTDDYATRHIRSFESFATIARKKSNQSGELSLAFPYYLIKVLLTADFRNIEQGLSRAELLDKIRENHHRAEDVRSGDLGAFLHGITQHQLSKQIQPPFVDYDRGAKKLKIIDSTLYFFLKNCDKEEILDDIPNPLET
ncbi:hypothetical protein [Advenella sp. FME57]|uniref:hypothetical protein n=1 Tax=Advenella sp. FME57 TaxID=2742604 RepID=UPI00186601EF|nr:hypothetical protein [Advenella sp. FME57]